MTSKTRLTNSGNAVSKASSNETKEQPTLVLQSLDGRQYELSELAMVASHKVTEVLLYNILLELRKKS